LNILLNWVGVEVRRIQYGRDPVRDLKKLLNPNCVPVVFDVGANRGQSLERFKASFDRPRIHAFEPSPKTFRDLASKFDGVPSLTLNNVALGAERRVARFFENTLTDMSSLLGPGAHHWGQIENVVDVQVETVDHYCLEKSIQTIDLLKIDAQGFDLEVLRGAESMP
jgi:FkbM family methyltransferase